MSLQDFGEFFRDVLGTQWDHNYVSSINTYVLQYLWSPASSTNYMFPVLIFPNTYVLK